MNTVRHRCQMEPENNVNKNAFAVIKKGTLAGHLMNSKSGKFAKSLFFPAS